MKFGAKYDIIAVFSARLYLDNLTLPEYNSAKQSLCACSFRSCTITYRGFHSGALGLSIGRFCRAYDHARNRPDRRLPDRWLPYMLQITSCDRIRSCATTGADHEHTTILKTSSKSALSSHEKSNSLFSSEICKNRAKISKIFNLIFGVKFQT